MSIFSNIAKTKRKSTKFKLDHDVKLSFDMGDLIPIMNLECVPGDNININQNTLLRMAPMLAPVMHKVNVWTHFFFVPNRILWNNWDNFMTNTKIGGVVPAHPYISAPADNPRTFTGTLWDYLGLPTHLSTGTYPKVSALPFNAYQKIYDEFYRAQYIEDSMYSELQDGNNVLSGALVNLRKRAWQHDYFTSALPFPQAGEDVAMPFDFKDAPVKWNENFSVHAFGDLEDASSQPLGQFGVEPSRADHTDVDLPLGALYADNSDMEGATTINELRKSVRLQEYLEAKARGGSRPAEWLLSMFGVNSGDARLDRPEFLGGSKQNVVISEVLQTSSTDETQGSTPLAEMAGHGVSVGQGSNVNYNVKEFGTIMGIMSVMPVTAYQDGIPKKFSRFDPLDLYNPHFANLGEQEIKDNEVYAQAGTAGEGTFGYAPRYSELKYENSRVHGDFRGNLDFWHFGRKFTAPPALNSSFIRPEFDKRQFAVQSSDVDSLWSHVFFDVSARRKMPYYGTPRL